GASRWHTISQRRASRGALSERSGARPRPPQRAAVRRHGGGVGLLDALAPLPRETGCPHPQEVSVATPAPALTFTRSIGVPPAEVFHLFTSPSALQEWCSQAAQVDPRPGGRLYLGWDQGSYTAYTAGVFTEVTTDRRLAFTWRGAGDPAATLVQVDFTSAAGGGTRVTLAH